MKLKKTLALAVGAVLLVLGCVGVAYSWLAPTASGQAVCKTDGTWDITWTVVNNEDDSHGWPAHIFTAAVTPPATDPGLAGIVLSNAGGSVTKHSSVPGSYNGDINLTVVVVWYNNNDPKKGVADKRTGTAKVHVGGKCEAPTTTTTTAPPTTTTTVPSTTTTAPTTTSSSTTTTSTSTTSTTVKPTTTTSTSVPTTTTTAPSTTTTHPSTTTTVPSSTTTSTTQPVTTTSTSAPTTSTTSTTVASTTTSTTPVVVTSTTSPPESTTTTTVPPPTTSQAPPTTSVCEQVPPPYGCIGTPPSAPPPSSPVTPGTLVVTGSNSALLTIGGVLFVAAGLCLLVLSRKMEKE